MIEIITICIHAVEHFKGIKSQVFKEYLEAKRIVYDIMLNDKKTYIST